MVDINLINQAMTIINGMKSNLNNMLSQEAATAKATLETQLGSNINTQMTRVNAKFEPLIANAQTQASQAKFQREDMLQNIQRQRQQQSIQRGNNYLEGLR